MLRRALALVLLVASPLAGAATFFEVHSHPGERIGNGISARFTPADGTLTVFPTAGSHVATQFQLASDPFPWQANFEAPLGQMLLPIAYENVGGSVFSAQRAGMFVGHGSGCHERSGRFVVHEFARNPDNTVTKLAVDFEQHCGHSARGIYGAVRFNSDVPYTAPQLPRVATRIEMLTGYGGPFIFVPVDDWRTFKVRATDDAGAPVEGAQIGFLMNGCGAFNGGPPAMYAASDSHGIATSPVWFARLGAGNAGETCTHRIVLDEVAGNATFGTFVFREQYGSFRFAGPANVAFNERFQITVTAFHLESNRISSMPVYFAVEASPRGGSATIVSAPQETDANGNATVELIANELPGEYRVTVRATPGITGSTIVSQRAPIAPPGVQSASGTSPAGGTVTLNIASALHGCGLSRATFLDPAVLLLGSPLPSGIAFPHGFVDFAVENCGSGQPVTFSLEFPQALPATATWWKLGPTADNRTPHWYQIPSRIENGKLVFTIVDGGLGDDDLVANGSIVDLGGMAVAGGMSQDLWWSGPQENGWGMSIIQHRDTLFANMFVYDAQGRPVWYVMPSGTWNAARTAFTGAVYLPHGAPFYAYNAAQHGVGPPVGTITITFSDPNTAVLDYTIGGTTGRKNIMRILFGPADNAAKEPLADLWWGGASQNGWGIAMLQQYSTLFSLWFTYDSAGAATWYVMPGGEWITTNNYRGKIYRAVGPPWLGVPYDVSRHQTIEVGNFNLRFTGDTATFEYSVDGRTGTLPLSRVPF